MLRYFLLTSWRNIIRYKFNSILNIVGLAIGLAAFILIMLWIEDELSYENSHEKADQIYRVYKGYSIGGKTDYNPSLPYPLGPYADEHIPEIEKTVRLFYSSVTVSYEDKVFNEYDFIYADPSFFDVFTVPVISGDASSFLDEGHSIVISEKIAEKYFGQEDATGKTLTIDHQLQYVVSGVIADMPDNTHLDADLIVNIKAYPDADEYTQNWGDQFVNTYYLLNNPDHVQVVEEKTATKMQKELETEQTSIYLQPLKKLHLYRVGGSNVGMQYIITFSLIAIFIIVIACINFMNLTTARYSNRSKEIGLKKVIGVSRQQLIRQFLGESLIMTIIAAILAMMLAELFRPYFNDLTGKTIVFNYASTGFFLRLLILILITSLLSGMYPALFLSRPQPAELLRKKYQRGEKGSSFRRILVIIQFALASALIFSSVIIYRQLDFMYKKDKGYQVEDILYIRVEGKIDTDYESFRHDLLSNSSIEDAGRCSQLPCRINWIMRGIYLEGREEEGGVAFAVASIDYGYASTLRLPLMEGRSFEKDLQSDTASVIFNEEAIKLIGWADPVGRNFSFDEDYESKIIGVVKNFHSQPLTQEIEPLAFLIWEDSYQYVVIRTAPGMTQEAKSHIEDIWDDYASGYPFYCNHLENYVDRLYRDEEKMGKLAGTMTLLAMIISALGLIGLTAYIIEQKYKEIGIRKTFGASVNHIQFLLSSQYLKWVIIALVIALPVAWYLMNNWLDNFAYNIRINLWDFLVTFGMTLSIAIIITAFQVYRAAIMKPVDVLKYE